MPKKENLKEKLMETLSNAFISPDLSNPQEYATFWAIEEGFNRTSDLKNDYRVSTAKKQHKCVRKCDINRGDRYFAATYSWAGIKLCVSCMAMILYFRKVWNLPAYKYDSWDEVKHKPRLDENSASWKSASDAVENL